MIFSWNLYSINIAYIILEYADDIFQATFKGTLKDQKLARNLKNLTENLTKNKFCKTSGTKFF